MILGMPLAFISYTQQFFDKTARLVERAIEYRMLDLHLDRPADIAGTEPEQGHCRPVAFQQSTAGNIEGPRPMLPLCRGRSFRLP
jgi:ATP-binding cassette subfamily B protein RaxB